MKKYFYTKECYIATDESVVSDILDSMQTVEEDYEADSFVMENITTTINDNKTTTTIGITDMDEAFVEEVKHQIEIIFDGLKIDDIDYLNLTYR